MSDPPISDERILSVLKKNFGYDGLRGVQGDAVRHILGDEDALVLAPTGFGKSLCFQLPALVKHECSPNRPVAIICCPLIALLQNQVSGLREKGIKAEVISSSETQKKNNEVIAKLRGKAPPDFSMLYVTAERLTQPGFIRTLLDMKDKGRLSLFAIDEAHCISQWGHDFRPAYSNLGTIKELFPKVAVAAFTATATASVQDHIITSLKIPSAHKIQTSFLRRNIRYECRYTENLDGSLEEDVVHYVLSQFNAETDTWNRGIVYAFKTETVDTVTELLAKSGVPVVGYHGKLSNGKRKKAQEKFESGEAPIAVASVAFGMGIDVSAIRFVMHINLPKTVEAFYQESGRAGRDGKRSDSVLYYSHKDLRLLQWLVRQNKTLKEGRKEAAMDAAEKMAAYCTNLKCRRVSVLSHFGEKKTAEEVCREEWGKGCDVCDDRADVRLRLYGARINVPKPRSYSSSRGGGGMKPHAEFQTARMKMRAERQLNRNEVEEISDDEETTRLANSIRSTERVSRMPSLGYTSARAMLADGLNTGNTQINSGFQRASSVRGNSSVSDSLSDLVRAERTGPPRRAPTKSKGSLNGFMRRRRQTDDGSASARKKRHKALFG